MTELKEKDVMKCRNCGNDERASCSAPARSANAPACIVERRAEVMTRAVERGHQAEGDAGQQRECCREGENGNVETDLAQPRYAWRRNRHERINRPDRQQNP